MARGRIAEAVKKGRVLVSDGAWGTLLQQKGLKPGECPELWCIEHPEVVAAIGQDYVAAGADMIKTDSFGGTHYKLDPFGLQNRVREINEAAARLSREAAGKKRWVIASMGPTGKLLVLGEVSEDDLYQAFREQAVALEEGGADAVCIETLSALDEADLAVRAVRESTRCEVICTFTFERNTRGEYRTMMGVSPTAAAKAAAAAGAHIVGTNCGNGIERMIDIVKEMRQAVPQVPILVHANAGLPRNVNGVDIFPETPEQMAAQVPALIAAGANIVGGCCGTTPAHIQALRHAVDALRGTGRKSGRGGT